MSIFKDDIRCARLKRLGFFRNSALNSLITNTNTDLGLKLADLEEELDRLRRSGIAEEFDPFNENSIEPFFKEIEIENLRDAIQLFEQLTIVAAHKEIESRILRIIDIAYPAGERSPRSLYRFSELKKILKVKGIDIQDCLYFNEFSKLRLVSNSIKHGDAVVSRELSSLTGWAQNEPLKNVKKIFDDIEPKLVHFIEDFILKVEESIGCYTAPTSALLEARNALQAPSM